MTHGIIMFLPTGIELTPYKRKANEYDELNDFTHTLVHRIDTEPNIV